MSRLTVFTTGADTKLLEESCAISGIPIRLFHLPHFTGYVDVKMRKALSTLESIETEFCMWTDGDDSLVLSGEDEIVKRFLESDALLLTAAERTCWPDADQASRYPEVPEALPRFMNVGGYIGRKEDVLRMVRLVLAGAQTEDDTKEWTRCFLAGQLPGFKIDHKRRIFACMSDGEEALQSDALVIHWNGRVPGREEFWRNRPK